MPAVSNSAVVREVGEIWLQARGEIAAVRSWTSTGGVIFSGNAGARSLRKFKAADTDAVTALDVERYAKLNQPESGMFDDVAVYAREQAAVGAHMFLAPSQAVGQDVASLNAVLDAGEQFLEVAGKLSADTPAYVPILVGLKWRRKLLGDMCDVLARRGLPVAFTFASSHDPLGTADDVRAALRLISAAADSIVIRCDLSAIGLVAYGAPRAAIGTTPDLRHVVIPMKNAKRTGPPDRSAYVYIPSLRTWAHASHLVHLVDPAEIFDCSCATCDGRSVLRFGSAFAPEAHVRDELEVHAALCWQEMAARVLAGDDDPVTLWQAECTAALTAFQTLRTATVALTQPGYLNAWLSVD